MRKNNEEYELVSSKEVSLNLSLVGLIIALAVIALPLSVGVSAIAYLLFLVIGLAVDVPVLFVSAYLVTLVVLIAAFFAKVMGK